MTFTIDPYINAYSPEKARAFSKMLLERAGKLPGLSSASIASRALMRGTGVKATIGLAGTRITSADFLNCSLNDITPEYFDTMGMHLLAGRGFNWFDRNKEKPRKVIVNQAFARRFFPGDNSLGDALGKRFGSRGPGDVAASDSEIIGIVSDAKYRSLREPIPPTVYSPMVDGSENPFILHLRTPERPEAMIGPIREIVRSLDPEMPIIEVRTLREEVEATLWQERLLALLGTIFGSIAALLASIGLYGALDYAVKSRTREIGVRMAVGAQPARIVALFSRDALLLTASGIALGLCVYAAASKVFTLWISRILYDLRPWDPVAVLTVVFLVSLIAAISTAPAALRAVRTDPASALRAE